MVSQELRQPVELELGVEAAVALFPWRESELLPRLGPLFHDREVAYPLTHGAFVERPGVVGHPLDPFLVAGGANHWAAR